MKKKIMFALTLLLALVSLAACKKGEITVTFDVNGGNGENHVVEVTEGQTVELPEDPTHDSLEFIGWYKKADLDGNFSQDLWFDPATPIKEKLTVYAGWLDPASQAAVIFDTKTEQKLAPAVVDKGGSVEEPAAPSRDKMKFEGWFHTKLGLAPDELKPVSFPLDNIDGVERLYAYWEPENSKTFDWDDGQTYFSTLSSDTTVILNPFDYKWNHEDGMMSNLKTSLYSTEVDWDKAIDDGVADYEGDFTKIANKEFGIDALDYHYIKIGAARYPVDSKGNEHLDINGNYDREKAVQAQDTKWTFHLTGDVKFENGDPVTAHTFEYNLKQFLDPKQNNYRANLYFRTEDSKNGVPIKNAFEYFTEKADWDAVGFKVIDELTFEIELFEPISQSSAVSFGNMTLVHPETYEESLDSSRVNSTYGTPETLFVSYGPYTIKSWSENQKMVFNKNFDYVKKEIINYKSMVYQIVDNEDTKMQLFADGELSVAGLNKEFYKQYSEDPNVYRAFDGFPQSLLINLAPTKIKGSTFKHPDALFDKNFRKALFLAFDRVEYASNVYAPNTPSMLPMPSDTRMYLQDPITYEESTHHQAVLEKFGYNEYAYDLTKAQEFFELAWDKWIEDGNEGPITLVLITDNGDFGRSLTNFVKETYEKAFVDEEGKPRVIIDVKELAPVALQERTKNWEFDLLFNSVGFGASVDAHFQFPAIGFAGSLIGGGDLGMTQPINEAIGTTEYMSEMVSVPLPKTLEYLEEKGMAYMIDNQLHGYQALYSMLQEVTDDEGNVIKEEGVIETDIETLIYLLFGDFGGSTPFDGGPDEPYPGAMDEAHQLIAAMEEIYLEYAPTVPAVTRSSATIYADNVKILWPEYSNTFGWGSARYRFLTTDPDFEGFGEPKDKSEILRRVKFDVLGEEYDIQYVKIGDDATEPEEPERDGYTFLGWDGDFTNVQSNLVIKANMRQDFVKVYFDAGDKTIQIDPVELENGSKLTAEDIPTDPVREGYTFSHWAARPGSPRALELEGLEVTADTVVYAVYEAETFLVTFADKNGNPYEGDDYVIEVPYGGGVSPQDIPVTIPDGKPGYQAVWDLTPLQEPVTKNETVKLEKEVIIHFPINYNLTKVQSNHPENPVSVTVESDPVTLKPATSGYEFLGWFAQDENGDWEVPVTEVDASLLNDSGFVDIIAKWGEELLTFTITYKLRGGQLPKDAITTYQYDETQAIELPTPTKEGAEFEGWLIAVADQTAGEVGFVPITAISELHGDLVLVASWSDDPEEIATAAFVVDHKVVDVQRVNAGEKLVAPEAPTLEGHTFVGWQLDGEAYDFETATEAGDMLLVAVFQADSSSVSGE